jgi:uncharacterized membrane protein YedE/YeeE
MKGPLFAFIAGLIFSIGLVISGMTNPQKVIGFLDLFGDWDYSLAFVMGGAVIFNFFSFRMIQKGKPICANEFSLPTKKQLDKDLLVGSILFGIGWGLLGFCPGPAMVNLVSFNLSALVFVLSMFGGMYLFQVIRSK